MDILKIRAETNEIENNDTKSESIKPQLLLLSPWKTWQNKLLVTD